jgi:biotin synthase-related radical SAM superfamily protein
MVLASLNEGEYVNIPAVGLGVLDIGFVKTLKLAADGDGTVNAFAATPVHGDTVNIKIIDVNANEVISNKDVMF